MIHLVRRILYFVMITTSSCKMIKFQGDQPTPRPMSNKNLKMLNITSPWVLSHRTTSVPSIKTIEIKRRNSFFSKDVSSLLMALLYYENAYYLNNKYKYQFDGNQEPCGRPCTPATAPIFMYIFSSLSSSVVNGYSNSHQPEQLYYANFSIL